MATIKDVMAYYLQKYPFPDELSNARLTKMVYLADWESSQKNNESITPIQWMFHNFGPYVDDVFDVARKESIFDCVETENMHGGLKKLIRMKSDYSPQLEEKEIDVLDAVILTTKNMYWDEFIKHVYDTYPIRISARFANLDLVELAENEKSGHG